MISGLFWKSLGLANFFLGIGETSLGIGLTYLGLGETSLGYLSGSLGLVSVSADLQKWSRRRCLIRTGLGELGKCVSVRNSGSAGSKVSNFSLNACLCLEKVAQIRDITTGQFFFV